MSKSARVDSSHRIVGLGACGIDMLAAVRTYPQPDEKTRTIDPIQYYGGGNCSNTLVAVSRLGLSCSLVAKIGQDANGALVRDELIKEGICVDHVYIRDYLQTPLTYIIVDQSASTRTCIHSPAAEGVLCGDLYPGAILKNATMCILDTRHTEAAIMLAKAAQQRCIPVLLDVERERDGLQDLIPLADYLVTNTAYPQLYNPTSNNRVEAMCSLLLESNAKMVITTLGSAGSVLVVRKSECTSEVSEGCEEIYGLKVTSTFIHVTADESRRYVDMSNTKHTASNNNNTSTNTFTSETVPASTSHTASTLECIYVIECPAVEVEQVVDTTGAGDAFIGGIVYGLSARLTPAHMLVVAANVAGKKIGEMGARNGLPTWQELHGLLSEKVSQ
ncbi:hypothetical protein SARC_05202 [Sphaeroforma arctica JP610]|uniref:Carbohydrate kinase PfkB domain-containing protein n=1 Tax=Sphaeroforma arctica JP610 TaxID=667725 RepID=A0A0L0G058_9EUKA|nr:hypothetical protein SARC_05202 [Sphaeroforma arctica JP610]KNC82502.1 hypothetical protein SARC_05202 [Sphaeroforma arctica JP610]|eukprot:XP_014156404.1 hypothetical protein SARC_05202 [Sphaeroforma arctica JP610]